jgi:hypothetical protein
MTDLTPPGCQAHIQAPDVGTRESLDRIQSIPILHPLTALPRDVPANPPALRLPSEIDPAKNHIADNDLSGLLEA